MTPQSYLYTNPNLPIEGIQQHVTSLLIGAIGGESGSMNKKNKNKKNKPTCKQSKTTIQPSPLCWTLHRHQTYIEPIHKIKKKRI